MLRHVYTSDVVQYRDAQLASTEYNTVWPLGNPWLTTPPRIYWESIQPSSILGLAAVGTAETGAPVRIALQAQVYRREWPRYNTVAWFFDGYSGAQVARTELRDLLDQLGPYYRLMAYANTSAGGTLWARNGLNNIYKLSGILGDVIEVIAPTHWGLDDEGQPRKPHMFFVDEPRDLVIGTGRAAGDPGGSADLLVWTLSTGDFVRRIRNANKIVDVFREDGSRCYTVTIDGVVSLIDYVSGDILGVMGLGQSFTASSSYDGTVRFAWDRYGHRILMVQQTADEADGACTIQIQGWFPASVPVSMSQPIPLKTPRKGRTVPVIVELRGDAGELLTGQKVTLEQDGPGEVAPAVTTANWFGCAKFNLACDDAGEQTLDATAVVE